jgi:hypothetical protein
LYYGIPGNAVNQLRNAPFFPNFPNETRYVCQLEGLNDLLWEYGTRLSGFLVPPVTGSYHFWICSDDQSEFRLSSNADPANLVLLCREPEFNAYRQFAASTRRNGGAPENRSQTLFPAGRSLVAGEPYYFEVLAKNSALYGNVSVAWQIPGEPAPTNGSAPIPGRYLAALIDPTRVTLAIQQNPVDVGYSFADTGGGGEHVLLNEPFNTSDGQFEAALRGDPAGGWVYQPDTGAWRADGSGASSVPSDKTLTSPPLTVTRKGSALLDFTHRYSFEFDGSIGWDGGQVRISVNGGPFVSVPSQAFVANGYTRAIDGIAGLLGQQAFNGDSAGYESGLAVVSTARLGFFSPGDVIRIQFFGAWDEFITGTTPNWFIDSVRLVEGLPGGPAVTFSVKAQGNVQFAPNQGLLYQWQQDCGQGFSDIPGATEPVLNFSPAPSDAGCWFRCVVELPGATLASGPARLVVLAPTLAIARFAGRTIVTWNEAGRLQQAPSPTGSWSEVPGVHGNSYEAPADVSPHFYRLVLP